MKRTHQIGGGIALTLGLALFSQCPEDEANNSVSVDSNSSVRTYDRSHRSVSEDAEEPVEDPRIIVPSNEDGAILDDFKVGDALRACLTAGQSNGSSGLKCIQPHGGAFTTCFDPEGHGLSFEIQDSRASNAALAILGIKRNSTTEHFTVGLADLEAVAMGVPAGFPEGGSVMTFEYDWNNAAEAQEVLNQACEDIIADARNSRPCDYPDSPLCDQENFEVRNKIADQLRDINDLVSDAESELITEGITSERVDGLSLKFSLSESELEVNVVPYGTFKEGNIRTLVSVRSIALGGLTEGSDYGFNAEVEGCKAWGSTLAEVLEELENHCL